MEQWALQWEREMGYKPQWIHPHFFSSFLPSFLPPSPFLPSFPLFVHVFSRFSHVWLFATQWIVACQAPLSVGFPRQEYWSEIQRPPTGNLPIQGSNLPLLCCRWIAYHWATRKALFPSAAAKSLQSCLTLLQPHRRQPTRLPLRNI